MADVWKEAAEQAGVVGKKKKKRKRSDIPLAGTQGRGGVTPLEVQRQISAEGGPRTAWPETQPGAAPAIQRQAPGVEGYVPQRGAVAALPADVLASIEEQVQGPIDNTLKNLTLAHYELFHSWPDYTLTADILSNGELKFDTLEEAKQFFSGITGAFEASGQSWALDASLDVFGGAQERKDAGFTAETDILDPEMLASFRPEKVEDFLLGPYMKRTADGQTERFRSTDLRLDEMLVAVPRQWAISNLSERLTARSKRFNPDRDEDVALMEDLNDFLRSRVPEEIAPKAGARWQANTEQSLRYLQMMRAGALYVASEGQDPEAAGFLETQGFSDILRTLDEQIRVKTDPTGNTDEARRAWIQEWYVQSRNPGMTEGQAIHELGNLNLDMVTVEGQKQIGTDHLKGYAGAISGFFGSIPGLNQLDDVLADAVRSDEFRAATSWAIPIASAMGTVMKPAVMYPLEAFAWAYEGYDKYADSLLISIRNSENSVLATTLKTAFAGAAGAAAGLAFGPVGIAAGMGIALLGPSALLTERDENGDFGSVLGEFFTMAYNAFDGDVEWIGDFTENWTETMKHREADRTGEGVAYDYTDVVLRDLGLNPNTHPEVAFLVEFGFDTFRDFAVAKGFGSAAKAVMATKLWTGEKGIRALSGSVLHQATLSDTAVRYFEESVLKGEAAMRYADHHGMPPLGEKSFVAKHAAVFGSHPEDAHNLHRTLRAAWENGLSPEDMRVVARETINNNFRKTGRGKLDADSWGVHARIRERTLFNENGFIYRGKHPHLSRMFERIYSEMNFSAMDDAVPNAMRHAGFMVRTGFDPEDVPTLKKYLRIDAEASSDWELVAEIDNARDIYQLSSIVEGTYADADLWANRVLYRDWRASTVRHAEMEMQAGNVERANELNRLLGETFDRGRLQDLEELQSKVVHRRLYLVRDLESIQTYRMLTREASSAHFRRSFRKDKEFARWHKLAADIAENEGREIADDFVPMGAMYRKFSDASVNPDVKIDIHSTRASRPDAGLTDAVGRMTDRENYPAYMARPGAPVREGVIDEVSGAFDYNAVPSWQRALKGYVEGDPDLGTPGIRDLYHDAGLLTPDELQGIQLTMTGLEKVLAKSKRLADEAVQKYGRGKRGLKDLDKVIVKLQNEIDERAATLQRMRAKVGEKPQHFERRRAKQQAKVTDAQQRRAAVQLEKAKVKTEEATAKAKEIETLDTQIDETVAVEREAERIITENREAIHAINQRISEAMQADTEYVERIAPLFDQMESRTRVDFEIAVQQEKDAQAIVTFMGDNATPIELEQLRRASEDASIASTLWREAAHREAVAEAYHVQAAQLGMRPFVDPLSGKVTWRYGTNVRPKVPFVFDDRARDVLAVGDELDEPALALPEWLRERAYELVAADDVDGATRLILDHFTRILIAGEMVMPDEKAILAAGEVVTGKLGRQAAKETALPKGKLPPTPAGTAPTARGETASAARRAELQRRKAETEAAAPKAMAEKRSIIDVIEEYNEELADLTRWRDQLQRRINAAYAAKDQRRLDALWPQMETIETQMRSCMTFRDEFAQRLKNGETTVSGATLTQRGSQLRRPTLPEPKLAALTPEEIEAQAGGLSARTGEYIGKKGKTRERMVREKEDLEPDDFEVPEPQEAAGQAAEEAPTVAGRTAEEIEDAIGMEGAATPTEELMGATRVFETGEGAHIAEVAVEKWAPPNQEAINALVRICQQAWRQDSLPIRVPRSYIEPLEGQGAWGDIAPMITETGARRMEILGTGDIAEARRPLGTYWSGDSWANYERNYGELEGVGIGPGMLQLGKQDIPTFDVPWLAKWIGGVRRGSMLQKRRTPAEIRMVLKKNKLIVGEGQLAAMPKKLSPGAWTDDEITEAVYTIREAFAMAGMKEEGEKVVRQYVEALIETSQREQVQQVGGIVARVLGSIVEKNLDGYAPLLVDLPETMIERNARIAAMRPAVSVNPARHVVRSFGRINDPKAAQLGRPSSSSRSDFPALANPVVPKGHSAKAVNKAVAEFEEMWDEILTGEQGSFSYGKGKYARTYSYEQARQQFHQLAQDVVDGRYTGLVCPLSKKGHGVGGRCHVEVLQERLVTYIREQGLQPRASAAARAADPLTAVSPELRRIIQHSGGAIGGDELWDDIGREFGIGESRHYFSQGGMAPRPPRGNVELTRADFLAEAVDKIVAQTAKVLGKGMPGEKTLPLIRRNWWQVKNSEAVYAVAPIKGDLVQGGTGWAVHMAIGVGKPVHVFSPTHGKWFTWNGTTFVEEVTPTLTDNFAGIGSRTVKKGSRGEKAIREVYEKTLAERDPAFAAQRVAAVPMRSVADIEAEMTKLTKRMQQAKKRTENIDVTAPRARYRELQEELKAAKEAEAAAPAAALEERVVTGGDIFDGSGIPIITTNLGGVHGAGIAKMAADKGLVTKGKGAFSDSTEKAVVFPVKKNWREKADLDLIKESFDKLGKLVDAHPDKTFLLPAVGLGHGGRTVEEVAPLIRAFLEAHPNVKLVLPSDAVKQGMKVAKSAQLSEDKGLAEAVLGGIRQPMMTDMRPLEAEDTVRLYRPTKSNVAEGLPRKSDEWWTMDPAVAARGGDISYIDVPRSKLGEFAVYDNERLVIPQGHPLTAGRQSYTPTVAEESLHTATRTLAEVEKELQGVTRMIETKIDEIATLEEQYGPLELIDEIAVRGLHDKENMKLLFASWDKRLMARWEEEREKLQQHFDLLNEMLGAQNVDAIRVTAVVREAEMDLLRASQETARLDAFRKTMDALEEEYLDLTDTGNELASELRSMERANNINSMFLREKAETEQALDEIKVQMRALEAKMDKLYDDQSDLMVPRGQEGDWTPEELTPEPLQTGSALDQYDGEDFTAREVAGEPPVSTPARVMEAEEMAAMPADEVRKAVNVSIDPQTRKLRQQMTDARRQKRNAQARQRRLEKKKFALKAEARELDAQLRALRSQVAEGSAEELTKEQREIFSTLLAAVDPDMDPLLAGKAVQAELEMAGDALWMATFQPEEFLHWVPQPSREWQLQTFASFRYNWAKIAKFNAGPMVRGLEMAWSKKFFLSHSIDDLTTMYKTLIMMKVSTMLRIPLADEFVRLFTEGINPQIGLKESAALRSIDKLPQDIQFRLSNMIRRAVDGPIVHMDTDHPLAFTAYVHTLLNDRRDRTYARYVLGKELDRRAPSRMGADGKMIDGELAREVRAFTQGDTDHLNLQSLVNDYFNQFLSNPENTDALFKAWYMLGYAKDGGLRRLGIDSHRILRMGPDKGDTTMQTFVDDAFRTEAREASRSGAREPVHQYSRKFGPEEDLYGDSRNLVESLTHYYDWWQRHPDLGDDWRLADRLINGEMVAGLTDSEIALMRAGRMELPASVSFREAVTPIGTISKKNWNNLRKRLHDPKTTDEQHRALVPGLIAHEDGTYTGAIPQVTKIRDTFYKILDYAGARMNEVVYSHAFIAERDLVLKGMGRTLKDASEAQITKAERAAAFHAREYTHRVMFNNSVYMGEEMLRNLFLFLPAYRQFVQYWVPYLAKHPYMASVAYRANRDKEEFENLQLGPLSFDLSRMTFLINQGDGVVTGWLPSGAPLLTMPMSSMLTYKKGSENSIWGDLAGHWPFEFAGSYIPINSPLDKVMYGIFGVTLPWPFGSDPERNPWREMQLIRAAALKGETVSENEAHTRLRMQRAAEGLWNFVVPVGMRFKDEDVETMLLARREFDASTTPEEMEAVLAKPENQPFKTFVEWQNLPSYEQLQFLKEHPEIVPYMVSGFRTTSTNDSRVALIWSKMRDVGVADPGLYGRRLDAKYDMIQKVIDSLDARKAKEAEEAWWERYAAEHMDDHDFFRIRNEWESSTGTFAPGGVQYTQGHIGLVARQEQLNTRFIGIDDPFTGITSTESDSYRLAKFMDTAGGASKALLQMSPNYEMYMLLKLEESVTQTTDIIENYTERRMATRLTEAEISEAGYKPEQVQKIQAAVREIDRIWDSADKAVARYEGGYITSEGRAIRKAAIEAQNELIGSSPLLREFLGNNIAALYGRTALTTPVWERDDFVRLEDMDEVERDMFYHLTSEKDPETGAPRWDGLYLPEKEKQMIAGAKFLGYVPDGKGGWRTKIQIGDVVGTVKGKVPKEGKQIELVWQQARTIFEQAWGRKEAPSLPEVGLWRTQLKALPEWARDLVEEGIRADAWKAYLKWASHARKELRETRNPYYSDAPGFSLNSKFGMKWKNEMLRYGKLLGRYSPLFKKEYEQYNSDNELINSILGWYL